MSYASALATLKQRLQQFGTMSLYLLLAEHTSTFEYAASAQLRKELSQVECHYGRDSLSILSEVTTGRLERLLRLSCIHAGPLRAACKLRTGQQRSRFEMHDVLHPQVGMAISELPKEMTPLKQLKRVYDNRREMVESGKGIDWGFAEALAFGTLLSEGDF